jgi:uncharacterized protein with PIN domain
MNGYILHRCRDCRLLCDERDMVEYHDSNGESIWYCKDCDTTYWDEQLIERSE